MGYDIKKPTDNWTLEECAEYLRLVTARNKLRLNVTKKYKSLLQKLNYGSLITHRDENRGTNCENFITQECQMRIENVRKLPLNEVVNSEENMKYIPLKVRDPSHLTFDDNMKNTGIYLWLKGYNIEKYLGRGTFGVVWKVGNKAVKVARSDFGKGWEDEVITIKELNRLFGDSEKAKKHLNISRETEDDRVLEADLAKEDIYQNQRKKGALKDNKTIASTLRKSKHALKAVKFLHDAGYTHNDIKPTNMLKISKNSSKVSKFDNKSHKNRLQITDFGQMTKFNESPKPGSNGFLAPDWEKYDDPDKECPKAQKSISAKRDVYALGMTFLFFLFGRCYKFDEIIEISKKFKNKKTPEIYDEYVGNKGIYNGTSKKNFVAYLNIIRMMLKDNHVQRINLDSALKLIKDLKFD